MAMLTAECYHVINRHAAKVISIHNTFNVVVLVMDITIDNFITGSSSAGIKFTQAQVAILAFVAPPGRLVPQINVKFGTKKETTAPNFTLIGPNLQVSGLKKKPKNCNICKLCGLAGVTTLLNFSEIYVVYAVFPSV